MNTASASPVNPVVPQWTDKKTDLSNGRMHGMHISPWNAASCTIHVYTDTHILTNRCSRIYAHVHRYWSTLHPVARFIANRPAQWRPSTTLPKSHSESGMKANPEKSSASICLQVRVIRIFPAGRNAVVPV